MGEENKMVKADIITRYKIFGGKRYYYYRQFRLKEQAYEFAKEWRDIDRKSRRAKVVYIKNRWYLYIRQENSK